MRAGVKFGKSSNLLSINLFYFFHLIQQIRGGSERLLGEDLERALKEGTISVSIHGY